MEHTLYIVGVGPGNPALVTESAKHMIEAADVLVGGKRHLETYLLAHQTSFVIENNLKDVLAFIQRTTKSKKVCVLASGDPGLYSISSYLHKNLNDFQIDVFPGISAYQYFCAKCGRAWHDVKINSVHGRAVKQLYSDIYNNAKVMVFTGSNCLPQDIARNLCERQMGQYLLTVGENLSYQNERIVQASATEIAKQVFSALSMVLIEKPAFSGKEKLPYYPIGIADDAFIRAEVPMTKAEVRAVTMAKLQLKDEAVIYDIGAGTGSVSIEAALFCRGSQVIAVERKDKAVALIKENIAHFGLDNLHVVEGLAPIEDWVFPAPDRVFIGGTAGKMQEIIAWLVAMGRGFRIVINAITIETVYEALNVLKTMRFEKIEVIHLAISKGRKVANKHLMEASNPIYIVSADYQGLNDGN